jgi:alkaline phosphatase D
MSSISRRRFIGAAAAMGATVAWAAGGEKLKARSWAHAPERFAEGVASGDPDTHSVLLWTRVSNATDGTVPLIVEVAEDSAFERLVASADTKALAAADHTCRVLVAGLEPNRIYWYRFIDADGRGSRIGRTRTAARTADDVPVSFAFVSCQNICEGAQNAYRRMIHEDERAAPNEQLAFVLHLGDFVYEIVEYPEDRPSGKRYDRRVRNSIRFPNGEKVGNFHIPVTVADYRTLYRTYLRDPDLQDARARWPFVPMWDNHEFSWMGWQSNLRFSGQNRPAQTRKVAANQAWFEYQPARVSHPRASLEAFTAPKVIDKPLDRFDAHGFGTEPNNVAAIGSLTAYRTLSWGKHLDLIITDQHSYRSEEPSSRPEFAAFDSKDFPELHPQELMETLDAGRSYKDGHAPDTLALGEVRASNYRKTEPPQTILGERQKAWFLERLRSSKASWKVWGNSLGTLQWRADPQNLPQDLGKPWPGEGYACFGGGGDYSTAYLERAEIYDAVHKANLTGFVTVSGDRHSFWAGLASKSLPPGAFEPIGAAFITGSVSAPGLVEAYEHRFPKDQTRTDSKHAAPSRRALVPRIRTQRRCSQSTRAVESRPGPAPVLPRHGRTWLRRFAAHGELGALRVRVHPTAYRTQYHHRRRPASLSSSTHRGTLAAWRAPYSHSASDRRRSRLVVVNTSDELRRA